MTKGETLHEVETPLVRKQFRLQRFFRTRLLRRYYRRLNYRLGRWGYKQRVRGRERFCERILEYSSCPAICDDLARQFKRYPKEYRAVDGKLLAQLYLKAIADSDFTSADYIAGLIINRPKELFSSIQERVFIKYVSGNIAAAAPSGDNARVALEALLRMGYRVNPDFLLATALLTRNRTHAHITTSSEEDFPVAQAPPSPSEAAFLHMAVSLKKEKRSRTIGAGRKPTRKSWTSAVGQQ